MAIERTHKLTAMLSEEEQRMLNEIAERRGLTVSDVIRQYIRQAHEAPPAEKAARRARR